jgi:hypothetical protein
MNDDLGFFIESLTLKGPAKADAQLTFSDGLNVVSGASDTGKSYALSCIDFAFGASSAPSPIPEAAGYDAVVLALISRRTEERFVFERGLSGGDVKFTKFDAHGAPLVETLVSARHSPTDPNTLSGILLELSGLYGKQVRKNKQGVRRTLSFRDVAFLSVVDEERIIARRPPHLSGSPVEKTSEGEAFRLLVTGDDSGAVHSVISSKQAAGAEAKLELLESMIAEAEARFSAMGVNRDTVDAELTAIESAKTAAIAEYERSRLEVASLEVNLAEHAQTMRQARARQQVVNGLTKRFTLLDEHYQADTARLHAIEESGRLLEALPSKECPVCGAAPDDHSPSEQFRPDEVEVGARAEAVKIAELRRDLRKVLEEFESENSGLEVRAEQARAELERIQATIENELMPRVKESAAILQSQDSRRDLLIKAKSTLDQLEHLRVHVVELEKAKAAPKQTSPVIETRASTGEMEAFAEAVQELLETWKYPGIGRVVFSEDDQDLVISGQPRISHGKGVRALTCSAFVVGLLRHCRSKQLPHPSVVLLDSPLVAYREPDSAADGAEDQQLRMAGVKEAFYRSLAQGEAKGQVIVFENEDPPDNMVGSFTRIHFSKSASGRYGLFAK